MFLSQWSRETGFDLVVATGAATKERSLRVRNHGPVEERKWMPDEDSNLD